MKFNQINILLTICTVLSFTSIANARKPVPNPTPTPTPADLTVSFQSASSVRVYDVASYTVIVSNIGRTAASGSVLRVQLPVTMNSPTQRIMGTISNLPSGCSVTGTLLTCSIGTVSALSSNVTRSFNFILPHAEKVLSFGASVTTTSTEASTLNNTASLTPSLTYHSITVGAANVNNKHCTGSNTLSSFQECLYYPSSISEHNVDFATDGSITIGEPGYTGNWNQISETTTELDNSVLNFDYLENGEIVASFRGRATSSNCFEGVTHFPAPSNYVSPYRVCLQP